MNRIGAALVALLLGGGFAPANTQSGRDRVPVLAELFTSEGCNSCPPADAALELLLHEQPIDGVYVIALSEHVTYWDHQGWKDPFGSAQFTTRQQQYGRQFNLDSVFTPQLIVDGVSQVVGSDKRAIEKALQEAAKKPKLSLQVEVDYGDAVANASVSGPGLVSEKDAELWFALTEDRLVVDVKRGENANKTMKHSGVVRVLQSAGGVDVTSKRVSFKLSNDWKRENLRVVAFVQSKKTHRIISVGSATARALTPRSAAHPPGLPVVISARNAGNRISFAGLRRIPETHDSDFCLTRGGIARAIRRTRRGFDGA